MIPSRTTLGLCLLAGLAIGLRVAAVLYLESYRDPFTYEHGEIAENLLAGRGFSVTFLGAQGPTSQQAPFYPAFLAGAYGVFGVRSTSAFLVVQLLQCLAGGVTCLCTAWIAWTVLPGRRSVGWIAGLMAAVHPAQVYAVTHLQVAVWATMLLTLLVAVTLSPSLRGWKAAILLGGLGGLLLLVEPIFAVVMPIVAAAYWLRGSGVRRQESGVRRQESGVRGQESGVRGQESGVRGQSARNSFDSCLLSPVSSFLWWAQPTLQVATMTAATVIVVMPWVWRNYLVHGEFVFVKSTFGYAFWQGNNPVSWGTDKVPKPSVRQSLRGAPRLLGSSRGAAALADQHRAAWEARHETLYIDDVLLKPTGYVDFAGLTEPQRCRLLGRRAWQFIREQPADYARLCGQRLRYFLLFDETNPKAASSIYRVTTVGWLVLTIIGLVVTRRHWQALWPLYAIVAAVMLFHTLTIVSARFRLPIEPLTFVWAAAAVSAAVGRIFNPSVNRQANSRTD